MPRYHFVVRATDFTLDDPDGVHLPDHDAAKDEGRRIEMNCPGDAALLIKDETGQLRPRWPR